MNICNKVEETLCNLNKVSLHQAVVTLKYFFQVKQSETVTNAMSGIKVHKENIWLSTSLFHKLFFTPAFQSLNGEMARKFSVSLSKDHVENMEIKEAEITALRK